MEMFSFTSVPKFCIDESFPLLLGKSGQRIDLSNEEFSVRRANFWGSRHSSIDTNTAVSTP